MATDLFDELFGSAELNKDADYPRMIAVALAGASTDDHEQRMEYLTLAQVFTSLAILRRLERMGVMHSKIPGGM